MLAIPATEAILPAIRRTQAFLFRPFRLDTYLKLCLVACITEGLGGNFNATIPGGNRRYGPHHLFTPPALTPLWIAALVAIAVALFVLGFVCFYLVTRLRFAYFHCLVSGTREIRPGWRLYHAQATRFFVLNLLVAFCLLLVSAIAALPFVFGFWRLFHNQPPGGHPSLVALFALILPLIPVVFLLVLAGLAAELILHDFMLPRLALEEIPAGQAWNATWAGIKAEKGSFFVYALLRIFLPIAASIALFVVLILPAIFAGAAVVLAEVSLHAAIAHATGAAALFGIGLQILIGAIACAVAVLLLIGLGGPIRTAVREYALVFYGSRYLPLGNLLWPPLAPSTPDNI